MRNDKPWQDVKTFDFKKHDTFGTYKYSKYTFKLAKKPGENGFDQAYITINDEEEEYMLNGSVAHGSPTQDAVNFIKGFLAGRCLPNCWNCNKLAEEMEKLCDEFLGDSGMEPTRFAIKMRKLMQEYKK